MDRVSQVVASRSARPRVSDSDYSPILQVMTWLLLTTSLLAIALRFSTRLSTYRTLARDDLVILASFLLNIGQSSAILSPSGNAWGKPIDSLTPETIDQALKVLLAVNILYLFGLMLSKVSFILFFHDLAEARRPLKTTTGVTVFTFAWAVIFTIVYGFQCSLPRSWNTTSGNCVDLRAVDIANGVISIVGEGLLFALALCVVLPLRMTLRKRMTVLAWCSTRLLVIAAVAVQISYVHTRFETNFTRSTVPLMIATQAVPTLSIVTASMPFMKRFMNSLESGFLRVDDRRRRGQVVHSSQGTSIGEESNGSGLTPPSTHKAAVNDVQVSRLQPH